jgi:transposase InsO family protein
MATCGLLGMNRQVYYRRIKSAKKRKSTAQQVVDLVSAVRTKMPRLGTKKLYHLLQEDLRVLGVGRDMLFRILGANHMLIVPKRQYHITTNSHHRFRKHKNLIVDVVPHKPEQIWVSDITYVGNRTNPMYLALVTDAYSKKIMGYDVSDSLDTKGSIRALKMAIKTRCYKPNTLIHHSDRGLQYCSYPYQKVLKKANLGCSMTESYDPYANAVAERVNGILKAEFIGYNPSHKLAVMQKLISDSIKIYNDYRPHYSCFMKTPKQMHQQNEIKIRTYKNKYSSKRAFAGV